MNAPLNVRPFSNHKEKENHCDFKVSLKFVLNKEICDERENAWSGNRSWIVHLSPPSKMTDIKYYMLARDIYFRSTGALHNFSKKLPSRTHV